MQRRNLYKLFFSTVLFVFLTVSVNASQDASSSKKVQIFANGKVYTSFDEYRSKRFKSQMIESLPDEERKLFERYLVANKGFISIDNTDMISFDRFQDLYDEFRTAHTRSIILNTELPLEVQPETAKTTDPMADMEQMLENLQAQKQEARQITLNPSKMKTITFDKSVPSWE